MSSWWQRWRRARTLERRPIPDELWTLTLLRFPFLAARSAEKVSALREMTTLFLAAKEFSGARGLAVSDEMAVAIAAQACLPALALGLDWLDGFVGIVVHAYDEELSGEAMSGGPVMLAWRDVDDAGESAVDGYNVVVHEFAHVIDMRRGVTAGVDDADPDTPRGRWLHSLADEYERFCERTDAGEETFLDPYAAEALEEFFAVGAEAFFVAPDDLEREEPRLYRLLAEFFRQEPAIDKKNGGPQAPVVSATPHR